MTTPLTQRQKEEIRAVFDLLDANKNGVVERKELATVLRALGQNPTSVELEKIEEKYNNQDMNISYETVVTIIEDIGLRSVEEEEEELRLAFRAIDRDNSGTISKHELRRYMSAVGERMSEDELDQLITLSDLNGDGVIDYHEFVTVMAAHIM